MANRTSLESTITSISTVPWWTNSWTTCSSLPLNSWGVVWGERSPWTSPRECVRHLAMVTVESHLKLAVHYGGAMTGVKSDVPVREAPASAFGNEAFAEVSCSFDSNLADIIGKSSARVVFIQDNHANRAIREKLDDAKLAAALKAQGFRFFLIEASASEAMKTFCARYSETPTLPLTAAPRPWGPTRMAPKDSGYPEVVRSMARAGLRIVPADHDVFSDLFHLGRGPTPQEREAAIAEEFRRVLTEGGRVVALFGALHAQWSENVDGLFEVGVEGQGFPSVAKALAQGGVTVLSVALS